MGVGQYRAYRTFSQSGVVGDARRAARKAEAAGLQVTMVHAEHSAGGWDEVLGLLPRHDAARRVTLSVNYRTPAEIMDLANRLLAVVAPEVEPTRAVRETGEVPRLEQLQYACACEQFPDRTQVCLKRRGSSAARVADAAKLMAQLGAVVLAVLLQRPIRVDEYPRAVPELISTATDMFPGGFMPDAIPAILDLQAPADVNEALDPVALAAGLADGYATAAWVMGLDGVAWVAGIPGYDAGAIAHDGSLLASDRFLARIAGHAQPADRAGGPG